VSQKSISLGAGVTGGLGTGAGVLPVVVFLEQLNKKKTESVNNIDKYFLRFMVLSLKKSAKECN
jgi:hypothetical protein